MKFAVNTAALPHTGSQAKLQPQQQKLSTLSYMTTAEGGVAQKVAQRCGQTITGELT